MINAQVRGWWVITWVLTGGSASYANSLPAVLIECRNIARNADRLECFDRETAQIIQNNNAPLTSGAGLLTPEEKLGLRISAVHKLESNNQGHSESAKSFHAHIVQLVINPSGRNILTLDNKQVWLQTQAPTGFDVKSGDAVTVAAGAFGSFWMSTNIHKTTRVTRVR